MEISVGVHLPLDDRQCCHTAGLNIRVMRMKNQIFNKPEGLRQFRDHRWKALCKENSDLPCTFFCDHILASYFLKHAKAWPEQKCTQQIWICLVKYSSSEVSDPSEVLRFVGKLFF